MELHRHRPAFDQHAHEYANFADTSFSWLYIERPEMDYALKDLYKEDTRVLEIGCGSGRIVRHFMEKGIPPENITGIDVSEEILEEARQRTKPPVNYLKSDAQNMPFESESFNLVTANMVLHMLDDHQILNTMREINRVLEPKGTFFFICNNPYKDPNDTHIGEWVTRDTRWGDKMSVFQHDIGRLVSFTAPEYGFDLRYFGYPKVEQAGAQDPESYTEYTSKQYRVSALLVKTGEPR